jgi:hypothetical protein
VSEDESDDGNFLKNLLKIHKIYLYIFSFVSNYLELGSDEESGKDWSDLERKAAKEDKNRENNIVPETSSKHKKGNIVSHLPPVNVLRKYLFFPIYYVAQIVIILQQQIFVIVHPQIVILITQSQRQ